MRRRDKQNLALKEIREKRREKYASYKGGKRKPGEKPEDLKQTARKYFALLLPHKRIMAIVLVSGILGAAVSVIGPMLLGDAVDAVQTEVKQKLLGRQIDMKAILLIPIQMKLQE